MKIKTGKCLLLVGLPLLLLSLGVMGQVKNDYSKLSEQAIEAKKTGNMKGADSIAQIYLNDYLFRLKESELMNKENLEFMGGFIGDKGSKTFNFFMNNSEKINSVLGRYKAQMYIMDFISRKYIPNQSKWGELKPDWDNIEKTVISKYGALGEERVYEQRLAYSMFSDDWKNLATYYMKYFGKYLKNTRYVPNAASWLIFLHVEDQKVLRFACDIVMKYDLETFGQNDPEAYDTYANLLHKTGRTIKAIEWEVRAVKMKKGQSDEKLYTDALEKMKKGLPTWVETIKD